MPEVIMPDLKADKSWFLSFRAGNLEKVTHCPACGSKSLKLPNDLWEWICLDCGAWWGIL